MKLLLLSAFATMQLVAGVSDVKPVSPCPRMCRERSTPSRSRSACRLCCECRTAARCARYRIGRMSVSLKYSSLRPRTSMGHVRWSVLPICVSNLSAKNRVEVMNYEDSTIQTVIPERHAIMGRRFYGKPGFRRRALGRVLDGAIHLPGVDSLWEEGACGRSPLWNRTSVPSRLRGLPPARGQA